MTARSQHVVAFTALLIVATLASTLDARADTRAVIVHGKASAKEQTVIAAAVTGALKLAQWSVIDPPFSSKDSVTILACLQQEKPWPCIEPYASAKGVSTVVFVEALPEKNGGIRLVGQIAERSDAVPPLEQQFCNPCSDTALAQSSAALARLLVEKGPGPNPPTKVTAIRILVTPTDASVLVDNRLVTLSEQLVPATPGPHRVTFKRDGFITLTRDVELVEGETMTVEETMVEETKRPPERGFPWVAASLIGGGAIALIGGSWVSWTAEPGALEERHEYYYSTPGLIVAGLGGVAIVGGIYLLLRTPRMARPCLFFRTAAPLRVGRRASRSTMPRLHLFSVVLLVLFVACHKDPLYCPGAPNNNCNLLDAPTDTMGFCLSSTECPDTTVCNVPTGLCVECTETEKAACTGATPACIDNDCQPCTEHAQCDSAACLPDGMCGTDLNVAYVDPAGTDNNACTRAMPCNQVSDALATNRAFVKFTGTIDEAVTVQSARVVTFLANPGAQLTRATGDAILTVRDDGTSITIYDLTISDAPNTASGIGVVVPAASGAPTVNLRRVTLSNNPGGGISTSGGALSVLQSTISGNEGGGISIAGSGATFDLRNNFIYRNGDQDTGTYGGLNLGIAVAGANRLEFNTIVDNRAAINSGGIVCNVATFSGANNIIARNSLAGSTTAATAQTSGACTYPTSTVANSVAGLAFAQPDSSPFDYHIATGSTAIDTATTATTTTMDVDDESRPQGAAPDRGADELTP